MRLECTPELRTEERQGRAAEELLAREMSRVVERLSAELEASIRELSAPREGTMVGRAREGRTCGKPTRGAPAPACRTAPARGPRAWKEGGEGGKVGVPQKQNRLSLVWRHSLGFGRGARRGFEERTARRGRGGGVRRPEQEATPGSSVSLCGKRSCCCVAARCAGRCQGKPTPRCPVDLLAAAQVPESQKRIDLRFDKPPQGELPLHEFEQFALDRMRCSKRSTLPRPRGQGDELKETIDKLCARFRRCAPCVLAELEEDLRRIRFPTTSCAWRTRVPRSSAADSSARKRPSPVSTLDAKGRTEASMLRLKQCEGRGALATIDEDEYRDLVTPKGGAIMQVFGSTNMNDDPKIPISSANLRGRGSISIRCLSSRSWTSSPSARCVAASVPVPALANKHSKSNGYAACFRCF